MSVRGTENELSEMAASEADARRRDIEIPAEKRSQYYAGSNEALTIQRVDEARGSLEFLFGQNFRMLCGRADIEVELRAPDVHIVIAQDRPGRWNYLWLQRQAKASIFRSR